MGVVQHHGFPPALDALADRVAVQSRFLRAAWYGAAQPEGGSTLHAWRHDGTPIAAIPSAPIGPVLLGARGITGSYWPYRAMPVAADACDDELAGFFAHPRTLATLAPVWRLGPTYADDPATARIKRAAARAGWTVLTRRLGRSFIVAIGDADASWPRRSTRRRLAGYERQLDAMDGLSVRHVTGADWDDATFETLSAVEAASWVGQATDGTGAKFLGADRLGQWRRVVADPVLAEALSATLLHVGDRPVAFSFDLRCGDLQYGIASSYDEAFAAWRPGKIVTWRQLDHARARGVTRVDLGVGDSGYKREMGAEPGSEVLDLLIVRSRSAASLLKLHWGAESAIARDAYVAASTLRNAGRQGRRPRGALEPLFAAGAIAAAALALAE